MEKVFWAQCNQCVLFYCFLRLCENKTFYYNMYQQAEQRESKQTV